MSAALKVSSEDIGAWVAEKHERFVPFAYQCLKGRDSFQPTPFDPVLNDALDRTFTGEITRLVINMPPRLGKTLRAVQAYVTRGYAINPESCFIHSSFSDELVQENSVAIRDIINSPDYQSLFPHVGFKEDTNAKGLWKTTRGGTFLAKPAGGTITGFGAGVLGQKSFAGALIIDDPLKPSDALSDTRRDFINARWENTFRSRLNDVDVPVIVIMQRIHAEDFTNTVLNEGENRWHHLVLPAFVDPDYEYKESGIYLPHNLPAGSLWSERISDKQALARMDDIQYSQEPTPAKGEVYEREWFRRFTELPENIKSWSIYCDTASKVKKYNDFSVFQLWAKTTDNHGYLVRQFREKVKVPFLLGKLEDFYRESLAISGEKRIPISIEDKDSGVGLIQAMELEVDDNNKKYKVSAIQRKEGKYARAVKAAPHIKKGEIYIMVGAVGDGVITEATKFKADDSHKNDDQIDPMNDFINHELPKSGYLYGNL